MERKFSGQEAMEFALIGGLVFCVAIGTTLIFGNKIAAFFENESAVAKVATSTPNIHSSESSSNFNADYDTYASNPEKPASTNSNSSDSLLFADNAEALANLSSTIKTSGASGSTEIMTEELAKEAAKLAALAEQTSDPELQKLAQSASELAEIGYYVADAQEWYEKAIEKYTTEGTVTIPDDNRLCENGALRAEVGSSCDTKMVSDNFLSYPDVQENFYNMLHGYRTKLVEKCNELKNSNTSDNTQVQQTIAIIDMYVNEISDISINLHNSVYEILQTTNSPTLDDVLNMVASKTTDLDSSLIQQSSENLLTNTTTTDEVLSENTVSTE